MGCHDSAVTQCDIVLLSKRCIATVNDSELNGSEV
jgi:hypothetical protein